MGDRMMRRMLGVGALVNFAPPARLQTNSGWFIKIGDLLANPQKYSAQEVRVRGRGDERPEASVCCDEDLISIRDDSGEINVRTNRDAPMVAWAAVRVKGVLDTTVARRSATRTWVCIYAKSSVGDPAKRHSPRRIVWLCAHVALGSTRVPPRSVRRSQSLAPA